MFIRAVEASWEPAPKSTFASPTPASCHGQVAACRPHTAYEFPAKREAELRN